MQLHALATAVLATDPVPDDNDVVAGWVAFGIFIGLAVALALLGWALTKQLKRTEANRKAGAFGPVEDDDETTEPRDRPRQPDIGTRTAAVSRGARRRRRTGRAGAASRRTSHGRHRSRRASRRARR